MNPFDLRGPAFLLFYALVGLVGLIYLYLVSRGAFSAPQFPSGEARRLLRDPYLLAYLRGGVREAMQTIAFSLNKRGLLNSAASGMVATRSKETLQSVKNPLELAVLSHCSSSQPITQLMRNSHLRLTVDSYVQPLRDAGLVADDAELSRRRPALLAIAGTLLALGTIKIYFALQRGHTNVAFLIVLTLVALIAAYAIYKRRRTNAGDRALADQQTLFARLRNRVKRAAARSATDEDVLVAAAFGLGALPAEAYPFAARLKRHAGSNSSSGCGSSCGGGGGSGCGGGCGGCGG